MNIKNLGRGTYTRALLAGTGVLVAVAVAGCSGSLTASGQVSNGQAPNGQTPPASSSQASAGGTSTGTGSTSDGSTAGGLSGAGAGGQSGGSGNAVAATHPSSIPQCKATTLAVSFGGSDAGMSQQEQVLRFTNTGKQSCVIAGFPGVSYVTGDNGQQVGAPAVRTGTIGAQITLTPGAVASTVIHSVDAGAFSASACRPTPVRGYRIYPPNDKAAMFIAVPGALGCAGNTPDPQLSVVTIKAGLGNPDQP
jgi:Protein of unknown function (DUF4232)